MLDIQEYYGKLARKEAILEEDVVDLLKELEHYRACAAYLASCQAATLEALPKSSSKYSRSRHAAICDAAAKLLIGDGSPIRFPSPTGIDAARDRCIRAVKECA